MSKYNIDYGYRKRKSLLRLLLPVILPIGIMAAGFSLYEPSESIANDYSPAVSASTPEPAKITAPIPWPSYGHSAYVVGNNQAVAASAPDAKPVPVASLTKVITAIAVTKHKPLAQGEQGPMISLTDRDVELYGEYLRKNGSVVPVEAGEQISQYQALQAVLMSSANNMSDSLVTWAFGSVDAYTEYANKMLADMGMQHTRVADASGFSPQSVSTAQEMARLGVLYMEHPVLQEIAGQEEATIPIAGKIHNYNSLVNDDGITGIKVGDTDEAGRCFLIADTRTGADGQPKVSVAVVLGAENLSTAMKDARELLDAGKIGYEQIVRTP